MQIKYFYLRRGTLRQELIWRTCKVSEQILEEGIDGGIKSKREVNTVGIFKLLPAELTIVCV